MAIRFTADEILAIAENIEQNGIRFYERAAAQAPGERERELLLTLSGQEKAHLLIFHAMRAELTDQEKQPITFDPDAESHQYLQAFAATVLFKPEEDPLARMGPKPSFRDILATAVTMEKDSIVFYVGMKDLVPANAGRERMEAILKEEMRHLSIFSRELARVT